MSTVSYIDQSAAKAFKDWMKKDDKIYKKCLVHCNCKLFQISEMKQSNIQLSLNLISFSYNQQQPFDSMFKLYLLKTKA